MLKQKKYAHVTFFFDGGSDKQLEGATRILVESPKVATYDMKPEMSAFEVRDKAVEAIKSGQFDTNDSKLCESRYGWSYRFD